MVAAIAQWFCLRLPSCGPGFESQALHLRFFQLLKLYRENNENKQKEAGIGPLKKLRINSAKLQLLPQTMDQNLAVI